jgi:hypothetical protein
MELAMSDNSINRREFILQSGAVAGVGTAGWLGILREAVERSRAQDKPLLTETNFNSFAVSLRRQGSTAVQAFVTAAQADLPKAFRDRFAVTSVQNTQISAMTTTERSVVVNAIAKGFTGVNELRAKLPSTMNPTGKGFTASRTQKTIDGGTAEVWTIVVTEKVP